MARCRYTQADLGEHLGLTQAAIGAKLAGRRPWRLDELELAALVLATPVHELVRVDRGAK